MITISKGKKVKHPHTKKCLELFRDGFDNKFGIKNLPIFWQEYFENFIQQALLSQAKYIRAEIVPSYCDDRTDSYADGKNGCISETRANLDELINSFK